MEFAFDRVAGDHAALLDPHELKVLREEAGRHDSFSCIDCGLSFLRGAGGDSHGICPACLVATRTRLGLPAGISMHGETLPLVIPPVNFRMRLKYSARALARFAWELIS